MTYGELCVAVLYPVGVIAFTVFGVRSQYRARAAETSPLAAHAVNVGMSLCGAVMVLAGARWWLMPSWPRLGMWSTAAGAVFTVLLLTSPI